MLTDEQVEHFRVFGYVVLRAQLTTDELTRLRAETQTAMEGAYRNAPFDGSRRHWLPMMGPETPFFAGLLEDPRFFDTAEQLLGAEAMGWMSDANRYVGNTQWHTDSFATTRGVKWAIYLDDVTAETGALRLVPGSHLDPLHERVGAFIQQTGPKDLRDVPAVSLDSEPGDIVAFDYRCWHASVGGGADRMMLTVEYFEQPATDEHAAEYRTMLHGMAEKIDEQWADRVGHPFFEPRWADEPLTPRRRVLVERLQRCGLLERASTRG